MATPYYDLAALSESDRLDIIGKTAEAGNRVAFFVDDDEKADRYIQKLKARFKVTVADRGPGPDGCVVVTVCRRADA